MNCQQNSLMVPENCSHPFFVPQCLYEFHGLVGRMCVHPLFRPLFGLCIHKLYPSLVTNHDSVKKFVPLYPVVLKKRQGWPHSLSFVKVSQLFWYPSCTELMVTQFVRDNSIQSSPRNLWKFFRKFWYCESTFSTHALVDFLNEFISHNWVWPLSSCISVHPSLNFLHHSLTTQLSLVTLSPYTWHNQRRISAALCPRKRITAHTSQLAGATMIVSMFHQ